jgi:hypothetical protein
MAGRVDKTKPWEPVAKISKDHGFGNGHIIQVLKQISKDMGLDERNYSTHSIRIGGSTSLFTAGARPLVIKLLGRWRSDCYQEHPILLAKESVGGLRADVLSSCGRGCVNDKRGVFPPRLTRARNAYAKKDESKIIVLPHYVCMVYHTNLLAL